MRTHVIALVVFVSGAVVMILELVGSRVLAPYAGNSLFTWTSLIGVILASLSLGYWWGGRVADRSPYIGRLAIIVVVAGVAIIWTASANEMVLRSLSVIADLRVQSVIAAVVLFAPASILLGMVSPFAVRLSLRSVDNGGRAAGSLYALSTVGSIVGTFSAGFFLIPRLGTTRILFALAVAEILAGMILAWHSKKKSLLITGANIALAVILGSSIISISPFDTDTAYSRVIIRETADITTGRVMRGLSFDVYGTQSGVYPDNPDELAFGYMRAWDMVYDIVPLPRRALMLGGGAYTYPREFARRFPEAQVDVVEIDPGLTKIAEQYFFFRPDSHIRIINEDARTFLNRRSINEDNGKAEPYDLIFVDVFGSGASIPFQMTTREAVARLHEQVSDDGVVVVNIISAIEGEKGKFFRAEHATYAEQFPYVAIAQVTPQLATDNQNIILLASKTIPFPPNLRGRWSQPIATDVPVLTDDYAPVEFYMLSALAR